MKDKTRLELYNSGLNDSQIAEKVGVHREAIRKWRSRMGLVKRPFRKYPTKTIDTICDLYKEGKKLVEIAKITGVSSPSIVKYLNERGLRSIEKRRNHTINKTEICRLYHEGHNISSISRTTGNSRVTISNLLEKRGLRKKSLARTISRLTELEKTRFRELYDEGKQDQEIATEMGRSIGTVYNLRKKSGLIVNKKPRTQEAIEYARFVKSLKYLPFYQASVRLYHKHKDWSFEQIAAVVYGLETEENVDTGHIVHPSKRQVSRTKTNIGRHLMKVCRSQEKCAFKPLLPETKMDKTTTSVNDRKEGRKVDE